MRHGYFTYKETEREKRNIVDCFNTKLVEYDEIKTQTKGYTTFQTSKIICCIQTTKAAQQMQQVQFV